jgi:hypothetical protein
MKKVLLAVNAEEYDHLCIAMDTHLDYLRANEIEAKYGKDHELEIDMMEKIKYAEHFYEKCKELYWGRGKYQQYAKIQREHYAVPPDRRYRGREP